MFTCIISLIVNSGGKCYIYFLDVETEAIKIATKYQISNLYLGFITSSPGPRIQKWEGSLPFLLRVLHILVFVNGVKKWVDGRRNIKVRNML